MNLKPTEESMLLSHYHDSILINASYHDASLTQLLLKFLLQIFSLLNFFKLLQVFIKLQGLHHRLSS
jgi:hypothetical protein